VIKSFALHGVQILNAFHPVPDGWKAEHKFDDVRRWRFDFASVSLRIAIEVEGGAYTQGRHTRGAGFIGDMEKYNRAVVLGWRVLRYTPTQMQDGFFVKDLKELINEQ
jgi:very-short-patch-repair endonuclease